MIRARSLYVGGICLAALIAVGVVYARPVLVALAQAQPQRDGVPVFQVDPSWPKPLPNNWVLGMVANLAVDSRDHVWLVHRPGAVPAAEISGGQKKAAPPVIEFDGEGNVVQAWGGPGPGAVWFDTVDKPYPIGTAPEHGIFVDDKNNVWLAGNGHLVLKFSPAGKLLMKIGELWKKGDNDDKRLLGNPTDIAVDTKTNEVYVADGYVNRRIIVFDANTGAYKRHWGAYGKKPEDIYEVYDYPNIPLPRQFWHLHCVRLSNDGLVYGCDRQRNRLQVFHRDGSFVSEVVIPTEKPPISTIGNGVSGSTWNLAFSADPQQKYLYVNASANVKILTRNDLKVVGSIDAGGGNHGLGGPDSKGNLYFSGGRSPKKFVFKGVGAASTTGR